MLLRARLQVVAPTAEVVAFTTAQHAVATLHSVGARFGCVKANIRVGDSLSRCCRIVLLPLVAFVHILFRCSHAMLRRCAIFLLGYRDVTTQSARASEFDIMHVCVVSVSVRLNYHACLNAVWDSRPGLCAASRPATLKLAIM